MFICGSLMTFLMIKSETENGNDVHLGEVLFMSFICMIFGVFLLPMYICIFCIAPLVEKWFSKVLFKGKK